MLCASVLGYRCIWFKCFTGFRFMYEWLLPLFPFSRFKSRVCLGVFVTLNLYNHVLTLFRAKFLVFPQLDILYLGGNHARVVCERVWRIQVCVHSRGFLRLDLASDSRLLTCQNATRVKHVGSWRVTTARALQEKKIV